MTEPQALLILDRRCPVVADYHLLGRHGDAHPCGRRANRKVTVVCAYGCRRNPIWACATHVAMAQADLIRSVCKTCQTHGRPGVPVRIEVTGRA